MIQLDGGLKAALFVSGLDLLKETEVTGFHVGGYETIRDMTNRKFQEKIERIHEHLQSCLGKTEQKKLRQELKSLHDERRAKLKDIAQQLY